MNKLKTLTEFTDDIEDYVNESGNIKRGFSLLIAYNDFLKQVITKGMFIGENPLFPDFVKYNSASVTPMSYESYGDKYLLIRIYQKDEQGNKKRIDVNNYQTVNDLVGLVGKYNDKHPIYGWNDIS